MDKGTSLDTSTYFGCDDNFPFGNQLAKLERLSTCGTKNSSNRTTPQCWTNASKHLVTCLQNVRHVVVILVTNLVLSIRGKVQKQRIGGWKECFFQTSHGLNMARPMASLCLVWDRFVFQMLASMSAEFWCIMIVPSAQKSKLFCFYVFWAVPTLLTFVSDQHKFLFCCGIHLIKTWLKNSMPQTVHTRIFNVEYKDTFMIVYVFSFRFVFFCWTVFFDFAFWTWQIRPFFVFGWWCVGQRNEDALHGQISFTNPCAWVAKGSALSNLSKKKCTQNEEKNCVSSNVDDNWAETLAITFS